MTAKEFVKNRFPKAKKCRIITCVPSSKIYYQIINRVDNAELGKGETAEKAWNNAMFWIT